MGHEDLWMMTLTSGLATFIHFALMVGLIITAAVVVRRHRPDAWTSFLFAGIADIVGTGIRTVLSTIAPAVSSAGAHSPYPMFAAMNLLGSCIAVIFWVLMIVGLVKLAKPPPDLALNAPPYR